MKKFLFKITSLFFILSCLFTISCTPEIPELPDINIEKPDTVLTLDKPIVNATAYPGMNFVSWLPVTNANGYVLYIYVGGNCISSKTYNYDDTLNYIDTNIKNNVEYTYFVEAESSSSTGRTVVTQNSMSEKFSIKAIVPEYNKNALQLVDYETNAKKDYVVNSNNFHIAKHNNDKLSISLPGKAYLSYDISLTIDNEYETLGQNNFYECISDPTNNDVTLYTDFTVTQAGTYKANVVVKAINEHFGDSDIITSSESVIVSTLKGSGAIITSANYKDFGKKIRVFFTEFQLENGKTAPSSYYKLYRSENGSRTYTLVSDSIKKTDETNKVLYVDDPIEDNTKDYVYTLVITDGNLYTSNPSVKFVESYTMDLQEDTIVYGVNNSFQSDNILNDIEWTINLPSDDAKITGIYTLEKSVDDSSIVIPDDFYQNGIHVRNTLISPNDETEKTFTITTDNHSLNTKVYLLVKTEKENKAIGEYISEPVIRKTTVRTVSFFDEKGEKISLGFYPDFDYITLKEDEDSDWNKVTPPSIPVKDCYRGYWRHQNGYRYEDNDPIYLPDTINNIYIEYELIKATVYFVDNYSNNIVDSITVEEDINNSYWNTVTLPLIPQKEGYVSDGYWYDKDNVDYKKETDIKTLYKPYTYLTPNYKEIRTAYFYDEDGTQLAEPITVTEDVNNSYWNRIYLPSIPNKEGYVSDDYWYDSYGHWYDSKGNPYAPNSYVYLSDTTTNFTANYRELYIRTAYFYDEDGTQLAEPITVTEDVNSSYWNRIYLPSIPSKDGYVSDDYWYDTNGNSYAPNSYVYLSDTTTNFTANYRELYIRTAYFYDENGNLLDTIILTENLNNDSWNVISLPAIEEQTGYIAFWKDTYGNTYAPYTTLSIYEDTSFTRMYRVPETKYANFLDKDGNIIVEQISVTESLNDSSWNEIYLPSIPNKDGYVSDGYWYDTNGNSYAPNSYVYLSDTTTNFTANYIFIGTESITSGEYHLGYISTDTQIKQFTFICEAGSSYSVSWVDSYNGQSRLSELLTNAGVSGLSCDVKVSIYSADGSQNVVTNEDSGYDDPVTFTANITGEYIIEVKPYNSNSTGYFAVAIN